MGGWRAEGDAGVVHQDVDVAELLGKAVPELADLRDIKSALAAEGREESGIRTSVGARGKPSQTT